MKLLFLVLLGVGGYVLLIGFFWQFTVFVKRSDEIRSRLLAERGRHLQKEKSECANEPKVAPLAFGYFGA
jgi:hypothetical protein